MQGKQFVPDRVKRSAVFSRASLELIAGERLLFGWLRGKACRKSLPEPLPLSESVKTVAEALRDALASFPQ